jgi:hypothetical protein
MGTMLASTPPPLTRLRLFAKSPHPPSCWGRSQHFVLVLNERLTRVIDRSQTLNAISDADVTRVHLRADIPRMKRRAALLILRSYSQYYAQSALLCW